MTIRNDFVGNLNCGPGTMPCGKACIPRGHNCNIRDRVQGKARSLANKAANKTVEYQQKLPAKQRRQLTRLQGKAIEYTGKKIVERSQVEEDLENAYSKGKELVNQKVSDLRKRINRY